MPSLMWECACGADNPAAAHACDTCGRVPGLEPDPVERAAPVGRRRSLPFSATGRKGASSRERAIARPPAGAPGPTRSLLDVGPMVSAPPADRPDVEPAPVAAVEMPEPEAATAAEAAALKAAALEAATLEAATLEAAGAPAAKPKPKRSFFDPEPEPGPEPSAAERHRKRLTPTAVAAMVAIVIALGVLAYVIVNTGNSSPPPQAGLGATAGAVLLA